MDSWRWGSQPSDPRWWASVVASVLLSALIVWLSLRYAQRRNLVDRPGPRRSHSRITARGGGVGIVVAVLVLAWLPLVLTPQAGLLDRRFGFGGALGLLLVAGIGWIDDHRPLSARVRIAVHFAAALCFLLWVFVPGGAYAALGDLWAQNAFGSLVPILVALALIAVAIVWSINLHNFMDGINGLLACQCLFVFASLAALTLATNVELARWFLLLAAAVLGFLPFNFPRATIFMGDVGSGALGFLIAIGTLLALRQSGLLCVSALLLSSAFVTDATCTLLSRMLQGRRWYSAHREHLYQWLARSGFSHAGVVALYMGWNFMIVAPVLYCLHHGAAGGGGAVPLQQSGLIGAVAVYALAGIVWIAGKRWCVRTVKQRHA